MYTILILSELESNTYVGMTRTCKKKAKSLRINVKINLQCCAFPNILEKASLSQA